MESLYPFLYSDTSDLSAVLKQVRASSVAKVQEILALRRAVGRLWELDDVSIAEVDEVGERFRPWRTLAAVYLYTADLPAPRGA